MQSPRCERRRTRFIRRHKAVKAQSAGSVVAGPYTVTLPTTSLISFSQSFSVPQPVQGSYVVRVQLSAPNSLTAASLKLNGAQIYSLSDFAGGVTSVDKVVTLLASDTIALSVAGAKGTKITITVFTVAMPKPTALAPNPLAATAAPFGFTWTNVPVGNYGLTAVATNDAGETTTSAAVSVTVKSGIAQVYYIETDHLNTPRLIQDQSGNAVWRNDNTEPFGDSVPNGDPNNAGVVFDFPLRFPGQYFDRETGLAYNWMRDYDPSVGRYVQSDPSGLLGGGNTYLYVFAMVLVGTDRSGLITCTFDPPDFNSAGCTRISKDYKDVPLTDWRPDADIILATLPIPLPRIELCPTLPGSFPYIVRPCAGRTKDYDEIQIGFFDVKRLYRRDDLIAVEVFECPGPCGKKEKKTLTTTCTGTWTATDLVQRGGFGTRIYHGTLP